MEEIKVQLTAIQLIAETNVKTNLELMKLKATRKVSILFAGFLSALLQSTLLGISLLFLNLSAAIWLGNYMQAPYLGFLLVASFYLFLGLIYILFCRKAIKKKIQNALIKRILSDTP